MKSVDCGIKFDLIMLHHIYFTILFNRGMHSNQSHTFLLSWWMQWPITGVRMSHRWNTGVLFIVRARSLNSALSQTMFLRIHTPSIDQINWPTQWHFDVLCIWGVKNLIAHPVFLLVWLSPCRPRQDAALGGCLCRPCLNPPEPYHL